MKLNCKVCLAMAALALAAPCFLLAAVRQDETYRFQRIAKTGETDRYKTSVHIEGQNPAGGDIKVDVTLVTADTVKEVKPDGTFTVSSTIESGDLNFNGNAIPFPGAGQSFSVTYDKAGRVLKQEGGGQSQFNVSQILGMTRFGFAPDTALKVGQEHKYETAFGEGDKQKMAGVVTILGLEKAAGDLLVDSLKIKNVGDATVETPHGEQKLHFNMVNYLDPKSGKLQKAEGEITGLKFGAGGASSKITVAVNRQAPAGKATAADKQ